VASVAELLLQQGRSQGDAIRQRGDIRARTYANLGGIAQQAIGDYQQNREQENAARVKAEREALRSKPFEGGAIPLKGTDLLQYGYTPEEAGRYQTMLESADKMARGEVADAKDKVGSIALGMKVLPAPIQAKAYTMLRPLLVKAGVAGENDLPQEFTPELIDYALNATGHAPADLKPEKIETRDADGSTKIQFVTPKAGQEFTSAPVPKADEGAYVVVPGPNGKPVRKWVPKETLASTGVEEYQEPKTFAPKDERIVQVMGPNGSPVWVRESEAVGKPAAQAPRAVTGAERQALAFFNRANDAIQTITPLEAEVAKMGLAGQTKLQYAPNWMQSDVGQQYRQSQRAFTEARLRKESGAAIPVDEYENDAKTYFAQPGDSQKTIQQKAAARAKVLEGLGYSAGRAYDEFYGEPFKKMGGNAFDTGMNLNVAPPTRIRYDINGNVIK
jgi:hypothetical protein